MTDFAEQAINETILTNPADSLFEQLTLSAGDTVSGAIGELYETDAGTVLDQSDGVVLNTTIGHTYTITVSGYSDFNSYNFFLDGGTAIGSDAFLNGITTFSYTFTATDTQSVFSIHGIGALTATNYTIGFAQDTVVFTPTEGDDTGTGTAGNDIVNLLGGNDMFNAGDGKDNVKGGTGDDVINGEGGNDILFGDGGSDVMSGGTGHDSMRGGADADTMSGDDGVDKMWGDGGDDIMYGGDGNDDMSGGADDDDLYGEDGDDAMSGGDGYDRLVGGGGADSLFGGAGRDILNGGKGDDFIDGGDDIDAVRGGDGMDVIFGGAGRDNLFGDDGDDLIAGGADNDRLSGGAGADTFVFGFGDGDDIVRDFDATDDILDLNGIGLFPLELDGPLFAPNYLDFAIQFGSDVVFDFGADTLTLQNTNLEDLDGANFVPPLFEWIPEIVG